MMADNDKKIKTETQEEHVARVKARKKGKK